MEHMFFLIFFVSNGSALTEMISSDENGRRSNKSENTTTNLNVEIRTSTPNKKLNVVGDVNITERMTLHAHMQI